MPEQRHRAYEDRHLADGVGPAGTIVLELVGDHPTFKVVVDRVDRLVGTVRSRLGPTVGALEEVVGHPIHPAVTDLPIGFWTSATVLDVVGGRRSRVAARRLVAMGVLSAIPSVLSGLHDAGDRRRDLDPRVVAAHASCNGAAFAVFACSWRARRREHWFRGVALGMVGAAIATVGGMLGGELTFASTRDDAGGTGFGGGGTVRDDRVEAPAAEEVGGGDPPDPMGGVDPDAQGGFD